MVSIFFYKFVNLPFPILKKKQKLIIGKGLLEWIFRYVNLIENQGSVFHLLDTTQVYTGVGMRVIKESFANNYSVRIVIGLVS